MAVPGRSCRWKLPRRVLGLRARRRQPRTPIDADSSRWLWPECLVEAAAEGFRPLRAGKWQLRTPIVADGCGLSAWSKLPVQAAAERFIGLCEGGQTAASNADSSRWLWPACLVEAVAERFRPLRAGKRQPRMPIVADGCGLPAWSKLPQSVLGL